MTEEYRKMTKEIKEHVQQICKLMASRDMSIGEVLDSFSMILAVMHIRGEVPDDLMELFIENIKTYRVEK